MEEILKNVKIRKKPFIASVLYGVAGCVQVAQPVTSSRSSDAAGVSGQQPQLTAVHDANQHKPMIKSVIVPQQPAESPRLPGLTTELPYRTRVNYKADDDTSAPPTSQPPATGHVTGARSSSPTRQPTQHTTTSGQLISVTSPPTTRDAAATRIHIGDHLDKDQDRHR